MKTFACKDVGVDCDWKTQGRDEEEVVRNVREHADKEHGIKEMSDDLLRKVKARIRDRRTAA